MIWQEVILPAIMAKGKGRKSKRATPNKARRPRPCIKGKEILTMCAISILLLGGTAFYIYSQLATVVVFGLTSATLLMLFVIPTFYQWFAIKIND